MSSTLRVELPAYSHSFHVPVTPLSTIRDVKQEIAHTCPGSPSPDGQRVIWKGRILKDEEKVEDIWKSPHDSRVVHLAVNPSAWTSAPPSLPARSTSLRHSTPPRPTPTQTVPHTSAQTSTQPLPLPHLNAYALPHLASLSYIQYMHAMALGVLSAGSVFPPTQLTMMELETSRSAAKHLYYSQGWTWPSIFDVPFPSGSPDQGVVYQPATLEGLPYLQLISPNVTPTDAQLHALKVLTYTFSILSMAYDYAPANPYPHHTHTPPTNLNQHLQQLGFPPLRVPQNQVVNPDVNGVNPLPQPGAGAVEIRAIPLRALMVPILMLAFRALLILYFFSPTKRPVFGVLLSLWILYETWNAMRMVLNEGNGNERGAEGAGANPAAPNAALGADAAANPGAPGDNPIRPTLNASPGRSALQSILDYFSTINLAAEDAMLDTDAPHPPPSMAQRAKMFVVLFVMTVYPAAWNRRRTALRRREGRIRTEANAREAAMNRREHANAGGDAEGQEQTRNEEQEASARTREQMVARHERRPVWLKDYVDRVQYTEWAEDL